MATKENITQTLVNKINIQIEKGAPKINDVWDTKTSGFGIRVGKTGATYIFKYRNKCNRCQTKTLGKTTDMSVNEARDLLDEFKPTIKSDSLRISKRNKNFTVKDLCEKYQNEHQVRASTKKVDKSRITRHIMPIIGDIRLSDLTTEDVLKLQAAIATGDKRIVIAGHKNPNNPHSYIKVSGGTGCAKRVMEMLNAILNFGEAHDLIEKNPMSSKKFEKINHIKKAVAYLDEESFAQLGYAIRKAELSKTKARKDTQAIDIIKLLMLTGCRKSELLGLTWDRVDLKQQFFNFAQTKTTDGEQLRVFGSAAKRLLQEMHKARSSKYLFPSIDKNGQEIHRQDCAKALKTICASVTGLQDKIHPHSLRHSFATQCNELDIPAIQIGGLLGHSNGGVTANYTHNRLKKLITKANTVSESIDALLTQGYHKAEQEIQNQGA
ncbi:MAG: tyrosine-type recombinase/integrase [Alphaproteobacteria bacterium]|nr:tyrosine-type recombinase/integrase [Alphaproteobacteria bacterium]